MLGYKLYVYCSTLVLSYGWIQGWWLGSNLGVAAQTY